MSRPRLPRMVNTDRLRTEGDCSQLLKSLKCHWANLWSPLALSCVARNKKAGETQWSLEELGRSAISGSRSFALGCAPRFTERKISEGAKDEISNPKSVQSVHQQLKIGPSTGSY
jgi:hypothetical protein